MAGKDKLTDKAIKAALKAAATTGTRSTLGDGAGLRLIAQPGGAGWWRLNYMWAGKEQTLSAGVYPDVSLAEARVRRDSLRQQVAAGLNPSAERKKLKAAQLHQVERERSVAAGLPPPDSFEAVARRWHALKSPEWADGYGIKIIQRLQNKVFPFLGQRELIGIQPPEWLAVLRRCESDGLVETAQRVRDTCSDVYRFAIAEGTATSDPLRDLKGALRKHVTKHIAAITDPDQFGQLLRAIDEYKGMPSVKAALQLLTLVFLRPGEELRMARWKEFDLDLGVWRVPSERLKRTKQGKRNGDDHVVQLSRQAVAILRQLHQFTGDGFFVFKGRTAKSQPISENTVNSALTSIGFDGELHRAHGFRASARTMLAERLGFDPAVIETQLAHSVPDNNGRAYNRTTFVSQRKDMMQRWADYVDELRTGKTLTTKLAA